MNSLCTTLNENFLVFVFDRYSNCFYYLFLVVCHFTDNQAHRVVSFQHNVLTIYIQGLHCSVLPGNPQPQNATVCSQGRQSWTRNHQNLQITINNSNTS